MDTRNSASPSGSAVEDTSTRMATSSNKPTADWIAGRVETLLSHFYQPDQQEEVAEAAILDWVKVLGGQELHRIEAACDEYLRAGPSRRPAPRDILTLVGDAIRREGGTSQQPLRALNTTIDRLTTWAGRMRAGRPVTDRILYGPSAPELERMVGTETMTAYRSGWFFAVKDRYGEKYALKLEAQRRAATPGFEL